MQCNGAVHFFYLGLGNNGWNVYYTKEDIKKLYKASDITLPVILEAYYKTFNACHEAVSKVIVDDNDS